MKSYFMSLTGSLTVTVKQVRTGAAIDGRVKRSEEEGKDGIAMGMRREEKRGEERGRKEERRGEERRGEERRGEKRGGTWIWQR